MEKNKSNFKYGRRRSRSLGGIISKDICKTIKKSLPSSDRLQLLTQYALENALTLAEQDIYEETDSNDYVKSASECQVKIELEIEDKNYYALAVSEDENKSQNISLGKDLSDFRIAVNRFEEENEKWDQLVTKYRESLDSETKLSTLQYDGQFDMQRYQHLNYTSILEDVSWINGNLDFQVEKLKRASKRDMNCLETIQQFTSILNTETEEFFAVDESPQKLIKDINQSC